ncbi:hypothetical protein [uncultured Marinobacter sp.]|uniref:hypothetical protein n=1 Tax=uncultured Marinobacter sp. TaxID=187379 RepID=UPI0025987883|nr:hypothetical protein [uncultured Marinobacter sp.]
MLKVPIRPVLISAVIEQKKEALVAKKAGGSARRKHVELLKSWLMDTGCGHDLVGKRDLKNVLVKLSNAISPLTFNTANGKTRATEQAPLFCSELKENIKPYVLESTPPVLSVGKRCMEMGYSFVWLADQDPYFVCPDGTIVEFEVKDNIPYLRAGAKRCAPKPGPNKQSVPCAAAVGDLADSEPVIKDTGDPSGAHDDGLTSGDELVDVRPKKDLSAEANSLEHRISHRFKNPHCDSCNRSTMKNKKSHRGAFADKHEPECWGALVTGDHLDSKRKNMLGFCGEKEAFTILDTFSGLRHIYPTKTKDSVDTALSIQHFKGDREIRVFYSDNSGEINKACKDKGLLRDGSLPGVPKTNAMAERNNQTIVTKTVACLLEAGLPPCYWSFAGPCWCILFNTDCTYGESPWFKTHGSEFKGLRLPLGCKVTYKPATTKLELGKWDEPSRVGVFAGYRLQSGYSWHDEYLVWDLDDFIEADLSKMATHVHQKNNRPHITKRCSLFQDTLSFPLKAEYERLNTTLEGKKESLQRHSDQGEHPLDPPPPFDENIASGGGLPPPAPDGGPSGADSDVVVLEPIVAKSDDKYPPVSIGQAGDKDIFRGAKGDLVKLDKNGRPYPVREDGFRRLTTTRPVGMEPEAWDMMRGYNRRGRNAAPKDVPPASVPLAGVRQGGVPPLPASLRASMA